MSKRVALVGKPLRRRHSQVMHDAAFAAHGIEARYELRELEPDELPAFVAAARGDSWLGFQVTAPYKQDVRALVDTVDPAVEAIGAVNSVVRLQDGALLGFNTDAPGFAAAAEAELGVSLRGAAVAVAGAGGAACAVAYAALDRGAELVAIGSRRPEAATALAGRLGGSATGHGLAAPAFREALGRADLFVNATTVGMLSPGTVVDPTALGDDTAVFDLVYVPAETELLRRARERGLRAVNGTGMLIAQAAIAFRRWTGVADASGTMREALADLLRSDSVPRTKESA
jgi:shikimate dehydrogenase